MKASSGNVSPNQSRLFGALILLGVALSVVIFVMSRDEIVIDGHWRNDTAKIDYYFDYVTNRLEVAGHSACKSVTDTYRTDIVDVEHRFASVLFMCPQVDQPGYSERHQFEFSEDHKTFVDTLFIQGNPSRIDGDFYYVGPTMSGGG